jgi:beta-N-acetylhexosaminidase
MNSAEAERLAGRTIVAGFDGPALPRDVAQELSRGALGGVILFRRNVERPDQVAELLAAVRATAPADAPPLAAVDQEGGRVVRLRAPLTVLPPMRRFGELDDPELTRSAGRLVGRELGAVGFTVNFAPVLDVDTNPDSPVIGDRSFGGDPELVIRHGLALARGLIDGGVWPCAKHFPGHGDATLDSHLSLPRVDHGMERLAAVELAPFAAWSYAALGPVMTAHIVFPALDPARPATASTAILGGELRERLGFTGPVFTDDLEMGAITELGGAAAIAVASLAAGADGLLVCHSAEVRAAVREALARAAAADPAIAARLAEATERLATLASPPATAAGLDWIGSAEHRRDQAELLRALEE